VKKTASSVVGADGANTNAGLLNLKSIKLTLVEADFIKEYRRLEEVEREKGIKFFQCIGDPPHTDEFVKQVKDQRLLLVDRRNDEMRHRDLTRFVHEIDSDKVVVDITAKNDIVAQPKWDAFENNHFAMRRRLVGIFLRVTSKLIMRLRAGKRLKKIKYWIEGNNIHSREDMRLKVDEDYKRSINSRVTDGLGEESNIMAIPFVFHFNRSQIREAMRKLPLEYDANISSFLEKVEANPPTNFDDLEPFDVLEMLDFEI